MGDDHNYAVRSIQFLWQERGSMPDDETLNQFPEVARAYRDYKHAEKVLSALVAALCEDDDEQA